MGSAIEWTDVTWNPVVGCRRVSPGCENCYAERVAHRGMTPSHRGLTVLGKNGVRWTGEARFLPERLGEPLRWRKPRRVFVNSMSDLFHEDLTFEQIAAVFGVMAACPQHTFQVLTKRPARMLEFFRQWPWPLPNVHLGVSVEDQRRADERIPLLLQCPAALRFLSVEPLLERVDLWSQPSRGSATEARVLRTVLRIAAFNGADSFSAIAGVGWVIVGGESGPGARPFCDEWARSIVEQCKAAGVPVFVKQLGSAPTFKACGCVGERCKGGRLCNGITRPYRLRDRKGGDMAEWPADLRVRELPAIGGAPCA